MKTFILTLLFPLLTLNQNRLYLFVGDSPVLSRKFPIQFSFHKEFPSNKKKEMIEEMKSFNQVAGFEVFSVGEDIDSQNRYLTFKNGLYWKSRDSFKIGEQARTLTLYFGISIFKRDILFNDAYPYVDFRTLARHELMHSLGLQHTHDKKLMYPYLGDFVSRSWDLDLVKDWKKQLGIVDSLVKN